MTPGTSVSKVVQNFEELFGVARVQRVPCSTDIQLADNSRSTAECKRWKSFQVHCRTLLVCWTWTPRLDVHDQRTCFSHVMPNSDLFTTSTEDGWVYEVCGRCWCQTSNTNCRKRQASGWQKLPMDFRELWWRGLERKQSAQKEHFVRDAFPQQCIGIWFQPQPEDHQSFLMWKWVTLIGELHVRWTIHCCLRRVCIGRKAWTRAVYRFKLGKALSLKTRSWKSSAFIWKDTLGARENEWWHSQLASGANSLECSWYWYKVFEPTTDDGSYAWNWISLHSNRRTSWNRRTSAPELKDWQPKATPENHQSNFTVEYSYRPWASGCCRTSLCSYRWTTNIRCFLDMACNIYNGFHCMPDVAICVEEMEVLSIGTEQCAAAACRSLWLRCNALPEDWQSELADRYASWWTYGRKNDVPHSKDSSSWRRHSRTHEYAGGPRWVYPLRTYGVWWICEKRGVDEFTKKPYVCPGTCQFCCLEHGKK